MYEVIVGNIGTVHTGNNPIEARKVYGEYKTLSQSGHGRAAGEPVTIMRDGDIDLEYIPKEVCRYCGGNCPNEPDDSENLCDGFAGDIDGLYDA